MRNLSRVVAKAVLFDEDSKVLLIRRSVTDHRRPLQWDTPGGAVDEGEDYTSGLSREVKEETGIDVTQNTLRIVYSTSDMTEKGNVVWVYYVCRVKNAKPILSEEHDAFKWVSYEKIFENLEYDRQIAAFTYIKKHSLFPPKQ